MWLPIASYPINYSNDKTGPTVLLYDPKIGIKTGFGVMIDIEDEYVEFVYDDEMYDITPTHWMRLPEPPVHQLYLTNTQQLSLY